MTSTSQLSQELSFETSKNPPKKSAKSSHSGQSQLRATASGSQSQSRAEPSSSQSQSRTAFANEPSFDLEDLSFSEDFSQASSSRQEAVGSKGNKNLILNKWF